MVMGTRKIENKADVISISYMVYNGKKESRFFRHALFFIDGRTEPTQLGGALRLQADSGPVFPFVLHVTRFFSTQSHEGEGGTVEACGEDVVQKLMPQKEPTHCERHLLRHITWVGILGWL